MNAEQCSRQDRRNWADWVMNEAREPALAAPERRRAAQKASGGQRPLAAASDRAGHPRLWRPEGRRKGRRKVISARVRPWKTSSCFSIVERCGGKKVLAGCSALREGKVSRDRGKAGPSFAQALAVHKAGRDV